MREVPLWRQDRVRVQGSARGGLDRRFPLGRPRLCHGAALSLSRSLSLSLSLSVFLFGSGFGVGVEGPPSSSPSR